MSECYDRDGHPISIERWGKLMEDPGYRRVDLTRISPEVRVSTVWVGLNAGLEPDIQIFETMIFGGKLDLNLRRYASLQEAKLGHEEMVSMAKAAQGEIK